MPVLGAFAFVLTIVGLGTENNGLAVAGVAVAVAVAFVWTLRTWAERATGDDSINAELYHRFIDPLRTPVVAIVCIALVVLGLSRVLLAVSKTGSVLIFGGVAAIFFIGATLLALYPKSTRTITTVFVVVGALAILVGRHHQRLRRRARHRAPRRGAEPGGARVRCRDLRPGVHGRHPGLGGHRMTARRQRRVDALAPVATRLARPTHAGRHCTDLVPHRSNPAATGPSPVPARSPRGGARPASRGE